jgi:hypothetical protein
MKRITAIALFAIASFVMAGKSFAQDHGVLATIPFGFTVGNKVLPSGTYTVHSDSRNVIVVKNYDNFATVVGMTTAPGGTQSQNTGKLLFHKYGNQYFLSEILCDSAGMNLKILPSKQEKRTQIEEARRNTSSQTLVAAR